MLDLIANFRIIKFKYNLNKRIFSYFSCKSLIIYLIKVELIVIFVYIIVELFPFSFRDYRIDQISPFINQIV